MSAPGLAKGGEPPHHGVMTPVGHHLILRLRDDRVLAPDTRARRRLARSVLAVAADFELLAFRAADSHLHLEAACDRARAGELARRLAIALHRRLAAAAVGFERARIQPIRGQHHLENTFHYILGQERHHGLRSDPLAESSNLPDLLGLRLLGAHTIPRVRALLPCVRRGDLLAHLSLDAIPETPGSAADLVDAAAAAAGLPDLEGRSREIADARAAAALAASGSLATGALAELLGVDARTIRRLRARPVDERLVGAVRLQLGLRAARAEALAGAGDFEA